MALRSIILCPDAEVSSGLMVALTSLGQVSVTLILNRYPSLTDVARTLRAHPSNAIWLSFEDMHKAQELARYLEKEAAGVQVIAIHRDCTPEVLRESMRVGIREFVEFPFERQSLVDSIKAVSSIMEQRASGPETTAQIFSFLPSKAGVGTSTLALNMSAALARLKDSRVLLTDFDLNSGMIRFLLKLRNEFSVLDAVERSGEIESLWPQLVTTVDQLDVLHSGRINPRVRIESNQVQKLLQFMRRNYNVMCFDLSGYLEKYAIEIMHESKHIFLVCTLEIPSLYLAREKLHFLQAVDLGSRVVVVLNRVERKPIFSNQQVQDILGVPVWATLPNDYVGANTATESGTIVDQKSHLGKRYAQLVESMMEVDAQIAPPPNKEFLGHLPIRVRVARPLPRNDPANDCSRSPKSVPGA